MNGDHPMLGVAPEPGVHKPDPVLVANDLQRSFGGLRAVDVETPRDPAPHGDIAHRPQRRRQDDAVQSAHRIRHCRLRRVASQRRPACRDRRLPGGPARHGADIPADPLARTTHRDGQHARCSEGQQGRGALGCAHRRMARHRAGQRGAGQRAARAIRARAHGRRIRRQPLRRTAQASRDGPCADDESRGRDARRADGRREPGAHPVAPQPHHRACATAGRR